MPISEQTLETLEFPKILERLARHTAFSASRELALGLLPSTDAYTIRRAIELTSEARRLLDERPDISIGGARDIRGAIGLARRGGAGGQRGGALGERDGVFCRPRERGAAPAGDQR